MTHTTKTDESRLGLIGLTALVFGMMVGAGIFNIPQNMAAGAGLPAVIVSWIITAAGMLLLVFTFKSLADHHPELDAGIYQYAREGFGAFAGFLTAWGYWLCTSFANVAYAVMLNDTLGVYFPRLLDHGWPTVVFGGTLIWIMFFIVIAGMRTAKLLTTLLSVLKGATILIIIALLILSAQLDLFSTAFTSVDLEVGSFMAQIKSTMLVTLWCFIGIEGAVIMSGRARRSRDIGRAGVAGFFSSWILYVLISVFCFGIMTRQDLAGLEDPSVAYVMLNTCGPWAYWLVIATIVISLSGSWVAWTLICAEVPYCAARVGIFPRRFLRLNTCRMPAFGLFVSSVIMQLFLILVAVADNVYLSAISITGMMVLPAYLMSGMYLLKLSLANKNRAGILMGAGCTLFCMWMIYAGGLQLFMETSVFYMVGLWFHFRARHERGIYRMPSSERLGLTLLIMASLASVALWVRL
ncbi:MAG: basic amino acid/polyamine antiporter [Muribaculaceae bacterium]|nr:basic amino acid/polyamine antiporter [Muribaculaceae bacterium]